MPLELNQQPTVARMVWVLNRDAQPYSEVYNGQTIVVPPNSQKVVKMPFLEARRFLSRGKPKAEYTPLGVVINGPKALYTEEIAEEVAKEEAKQEKEEGKTFTCMVCMRRFDSKKGLGLHVMKAHPDAEMVEDI